MKDENVCSWQWWEKNSVTLAHKLIMAASATASGGAPNLRYSLSHPITKKAEGTIKFFIHNPLHFSRTTRLKTSFPIRALDPQTEEEEETENQNFNNKSGSFTSQVTFFLSYFIPTCQIYLFSFVGNFLFRFSYSPSRICLRIFLA